VYKAINISKGRQPRLLYSKVSMGLSSFVQKIVQHIFSILLKFTCQTCMIQTRKIILWWYGKYDSFVCIPLLGTACILGNTLLGI